MRTLAFAALLFASPILLAQSKPLAATPPMGWNSWDSYGTTINEQSVRANSRWIAEHLRPFGYEYVTIDEAWFDATPDPGGAAQKTVRSMDSFGRLIPSPERFPSSADGKGFAPLADYLHSKGLKLGIHVLQGIPKVAVQANTLIEGSTFHAKDAANVASGCQWNTDNDDLQDSPAGQAYYDSIVRLYASWHVDLIKIDCIASRPYKGEEIRMFHEAIEKSGAPIVLSLSPGAPPMNEAENMKQYAQQWRISDDVWDVWQSTGAFPQGVNDQITRAAKWTRWAGPDHWPDLDMLPIGELRPSPGWGEPRTSRLTMDEQRSMLDLWAIVRSPLVYGGDPLHTSAATLALLTNPRILAVDQHSHNSSLIVLTSDLAIYVSEPDSGFGAYVAVFNRKDTAQEIAMPWTRFGSDVPAHPSHMTDLWTQTVSPAPTLKVILPAHASTIFLVE